MSDPRDVFRLTPHNCGTCDMWQRDFAALVLVAPGDTLELPCRSFDTRGTTVKSTRYERGWRRASDSCSKWRPRCDC